MARNLPRAKIEEAARLHYFGVSLKTLADLFDVSESNICENWQKSRYWIHVQEQLRESEVKLRIENLRDVYQRKIEKYDQILEKQGGSFNAIATQLNLLILRKLSKVDEIDQKTANLIGSLVKSAAIASSRSEALFNSALMVEAIYQRLDKESEEENG